MLRKDSLEGVKNGMVQVVTFHSVAIVITANQEVILLVATERIHECAQAFSFIMFTVVTEVTIDVDARKVAVLHFVKK